MSVNGSSVPTGVEGLGTLLGGNFTRGSLVFLVGMPGAGKTVLGSQILSEAARNGTQALILTAFSESHVKLLEHLRPFSFFDADLVGTTITMLSMQSLVGEDPEAAATGIIRAIRESGARMVLIDGFQGISALLRDREAIRQMVASLAGQLSYLDVTLLVTHEGTARDPVIAHELTTADVVIGLDFGVDGWRHTRRVEVVKQRGRRLMGGLHTYEISAEGIRIFPRLEALAAAEAGQVIAPALDPATAMRRVTFGLPELDALLGGGLTSQTATILVGAPGVGKTTLALHWALAGTKMPLSPSDLCVFLTFHERPHRLKQKATTFGLELDAAIEAGAIRLIRVPPVEVNPDVVALMLLDVLRETGARQLVIDDINPLMLELGARTNEYLGALVEMLGNRGVTSLFLNETPPLQGFRLDSATAPVSLLGENVIMIQHEQVGGRLHRMLAVLKMRYSQHDRTLRELVLDEGGIRVLTPGETEPGVLKDAAAATGGHAPHDDGSSEPSE